MLGWRVMRNDDLQRIGLVVNVLTHWVLGNEAAIQIAAKRVLGQSVETVGVGAWDNICIEGLMVNQVTITIVIALLIMRMVKW